MTLIIDCPHCGEFVFIEQINCAIFRHAVFKNSLEPIPPHSSQEECERLMIENLILGCGNPFRIIVEQNKYKSIKCDYI